ncbi:LOW QUALITY PROTEIN: coiled-coil domain-containing protein 86-like [Manduca sexta]|uniref:LOW QUALITY PROTEIN: coiled-coil domain-containing protein 86-like n=1 Tax=Manduca sexta TaxID=7130 RepID=UPI00188ECE63|nr:LOW QUALITY PROTEIN: coiled-coil domain-containing protein 86-like [Manduca sexta]
MTDETQSKVLSIVANIVNSRENKDVTENRETQGNETSKSQKKNKTDSTIKGRPKSGKFWKSSRERFSSINKTKGLKQDFEKKTALRLESKRTKELSRQVMEQLKEKEVKRKERRRENLKKTEENRRKAEVVQVITNTAKLKRMRKKQLRFIEKRDTNKEIEANK